MKILVISNMYPSGEKKYAGIFVKNQYEGLLQNDIDASLHKKNRYTKKNLKAYVSYLIYYLSFIKRIFERYDVLHVHYFSHHVLLSILYKLIHPYSKIVVTVHGTDFKNINSYLRLVISKIDVFIIVGEERERIFKKKYGMPSYSLSAGVDGSLFYPKNLKKDIDLLFVGSLYEVKGFEVLVEALNKIEFSVNICIIGEGNLEPLINEIKSFHNVCHIKSLEQAKLIDYYNSAKFLVLPSLGDSFGLVITESMFCGTPVIGSDIPGIKQQLKNKYNGFLVRTNDVNSLAKKLNHALKLSDNEYSRLCKNARGSNLEHSLGSIVDKLIDIYNEVCLKN